MSHPSPDLEHRPTLELRAEGSRLIGLAIPFDSRSRDLGGFVEIVKPSAVDRSLRADIVALFQHDPAAILGRTPMTLQLTKEARGLGFSITPPDTTVGRETLTLVRRGDLTGASFGFRTIADTWRREGDITIRELLDVEIAEISLTAFPAYTATDVQVAMRSMQEWQKLYGVHERQNGAGSADVQNRRPSTVLPKGQRVDWLQKRCRLLA